MTVWFEFIDKDGRPFCVSRQLRAQAEIQLSSNERISTDNEEVQTDLQAVVETPERETRASFQLWQNERKDVLMKNCAWVQGDLQSASFSFPEEDYSRRHRKNHGRLKWNWAGHLARHTHVGRVGQDVIMGMEAQEIIKDAEDDHRLDGPDDIKLCSGKKTGYKRPSVREHWKD
ncbi:unnamed protein product [Diabrotica balteata]|uniref:Uncharacterized protein n=1 Tax=Diabrotica balteata TaxID=107213 RepID=A0A9P0DST0_DIABA|nr:unnamed protein product [Diabrotica balteata]